jgi:hypothetical protein
VHACGRADNLYMIHTAAGHEDTIFGKGASKSTSDLYCADNELATINDHAVLLGLTTGKVLISRGKKP